MKRIQYTAAAIRILGIILAVITLSKMVEISVIAPVGAVTTWRAVTHIGVLEICSAETGAVLFFLVKAALAAGLIFSSHALAKLFWRGIPLHDARESETADLPEQW